MDEGSGIGPTAELVIMVLVGLFLLIGTLVNRQVAKHARSAPPKVDEVGERLQRDRWREQARHDQNYPG